MQLYTDSYTETYQFWIFVLVLYICVSNLRIIVQYILVLNDVFAMLTFYCSISTMGTSPPCYMLSSKSLTCHFPCTNLILWFIYDVASPQLKCYDVPFEMHVAYCLIFKFVFHPSCIEKHKRLVTTDVVFFCFFLYISYTYIYTLLCRLVTVTLFWTASFLVLWLRRRSWLVICQMLLSLYPSSRLRLLGIFHNVNWFLHQCFIPLRGCAQHYNIQIINAVILILY